MKLHVPNIIFFQSEQKLDNGTSRPYYQHFLNQNKNLTMELQVPNINFLKSEQKLDDGTSRPYYQFF